MPEDYRSLILNPNVLVGNINRDIQVDDDVDPASSDGLVTGTVMAVSGKNGRDKYPLLLLEMNPVLAGNIINSYVGRNDLYYVRFGLEVVGDTTVVSVLGASQNKVPDSWAKGDTRSYRYVRHDSETRPPSLYVELVHGRTNLRESYSGNGSLPPFAISMNPEAVKLQGYRLDLTVEYGYEDGKEPPLIIDKGPWPIMTKSYRVKWEDLALSVDTEMEDVGNGSYDLFDPVFADREYPQGLPYLSYQ